MSKSDSRMDVEQDFMLLFENVAQGVIYLSKEGKIEDANPAAISLLGLSEDQIKGRKSIDARWATIRPDFSDFPGDQHPAMIALKTGQPVLNVVMGVKHAIKNKYVWILINAVPEFKNNELEPYRVFTTFTDISDQIELENKLRNRNKLFHLISAISKRFINIPLVHLNDEINTAIKQLGEFAKADRLAIFDYDFINGLAYYSFEWCAEGIDSKKEQLAIIPINAFASWIEILQKGGSINIPNSTQLDVNSPLRSLLDSANVVSLLAVPLMDGDKCIGVIGLESVIQPHYFTSLEQDLLSIFAELLVNVKDRLSYELKLKENEIKYREITENMSDMVWTTDTNFKVNFCSSSIVKIFGYTPEEYMAMSYDQIYPDETIRKIEALITEVKQSEINETITNNDKWIIEGYAFKKDKSETWFTTEIKPHFSEDGILKGYIATSRDESIRKKADDELIKSKFELGERLKEQTCVYAISTLSQNESLSSDEYINEIANLLPKAFQDIHNTYVHILYDGVDYYSSNFNKSENSREFPIHVTSKKMGVIKIYVPNELKFLNEEMAMMNTVIGIIEKYNQIKQSKRHIIASEQKFKIIANNTYNWEFWEAPDGHFIYHSPSCERVTGYSPDELLHDKHILEKLIHPDDIDVYKNHRNKVIEEKKSEQVVFKIINRNNETKIIEHVCQPIFNDQGNFIGTRGTNLDITKTKLDEKRVKDSELKYRTLFSDSPDGYLIIKEGIFIDCNKASELILGSNSENIIGKSPLDISPEFQPNGRKSELMVQEVMKEAFMNKTCQFEWVHLKPDGTPVYIDIKLSAIGSSNDKFLLTTWRDITAQREAKLLINKLSSAVDQSPISIFITDLNGCIEYANPFTLTTTGYTNEELIGQNPRLLKSGFTNPKVYDELWKTISSGNVWRGVLNNRRKSGSLYWESTTITPIINEVGVVTNYIAIKEDISDRIKTEHEIKLLNSNLEKKITERTSELKNSNTDLLKAKLDADAANQAKSVFLSRMSHELRTPLNAILGFAQLLELDGLGSKHQKSVSYILNSGRHLLNLINEVLEISRIEAGKISISLESVKLNSIFKDVVETLMPTAEAYSIQLINELENKEDIFVNADKQRIKQVLLNLVNNGIKYNSNFGWVKLFAKSVSLNGIDMVRICVSDNGVGIDSNNITKLFTPFERLGAENSAVEGTGLGLSVVKQYTELMGGKCGVSSIVNEGSIFWVELPIANCISKSSKIQQDLNTVLPHQKSDTNIQILYIEDNNSNIELVNQILLAKRPNIKLITSVYGKQTLELAIKYRPDLILLDLNLPDIHGSDVFEILKMNSEVNQIPVIVVSADAMTTQVSRLLEAGVKKYLTKPIDVISFLQVIDQYTNH